jgi:hypothetical protein
LHNMLYVPSLSRNLIMMDLIAILAKNNV